MRYSKSMTFLRAIAVFFCCLCFTSASVAAVQMPCRMGDTPAVEQEQLSDVAHVPCHGSGETAPAGQGGDDTAQHSAVMGGCGCVCGFSIVSMPAPVLPESMTVQGAVRVVLPVFHATAVALIDHPPKTIS